MPCIQLSALCLLWEHTCACTHTHLSNNALCLHWSPNAGVGRDLGIWQMRKVNPGKFQDWLKATKQAMADPECEPACRPLCPPLFLLRSSVYTLGCAEPASLYHPRWYHPLFFILCFAAEWDRSRIEEAWEFPLNLPKPLPFLVGPWGRTVKNFWWQNNWTTRYECR